MVYQIAICDDDAAQLAYLGELLHTWAEQREKEVQLECYKSAEALLFALPDMPELQILLLDVEMPGMNGVELARKLRKNHSDMQIIFVTGYADYMAEGYDVAALHYLLKPVDREKLFSVLDRAAEGLHTQRKTVLLTVDGGPRRFYLDELFYLEAFSHTLSLHTRQGMFSLHMSLGDAEKALGFFRCHRSYLVNLGAVRQVKKTELLLDNGAAVPLSRRLYAQANRAFLDYYREGLS